MGEVIIISTQQISRSPACDPGQFGPVSPLLGNKCNDLLILLLAELAPDGAEEDLGPVEDVRREPNLLQSLRLDSLDIVRLAFSVLSNRIAFTSSSCELYPVASSSSCQFFRMIPSSSLLNRPVLILLGNLAALSFAVPGTKYIL